MAEQLDDYEREFKDLVETVNKRCTKIPDLKGGTWHAYTHKDARSRTHTLTRKHTHASNARAPLPRPSTPLLSRQIFTSTPWPLGRSTPLFVGLTASSFAACLTKRTSCEQSCIQGLLWDRQSERHRGKQPAAQLTDWLSPLHLCVVSHAPAIKANMRDAVVYMVFTHLSVRVALACMCACCVCVCVRTCVCVW
jgi:hypothetical protein